MPGIVVFRRRWSVGSDDLVVPGVFLFVLHLSWALALALVLALEPLPLLRGPPCAVALWRLLVAALALLGVALPLEGAVAAVAMRGSILDTAPRASMQYLLYARLLALTVESAWLALAGLWLARHFRLCPAGGAADALLGLVVSGASVVVSVALSMWCAWDAAGRSWVKMKEFQRSQREAEAHGRSHYRRSNSRHRNWRQRKVLRAYQHSWDHRCRLLFCCLGNSDRNRHSFADIARLLSDFFRDLDVVPSDVVAGLVLLRKFQKIERDAIVKERKNDTYEFLSGVPVTSRTQFLALNDPQHLAHFQAVIHYMHFALGAYGWPMFLMTHSATGFCHLCTRLRCCVGGDGARIVKDNCCHCNYAALRKMLEVGDVEVVFATYHVDVGETPFFVAVDATRHAVVVSIRGTLSLQDVITDLNADGEPLPVAPVRDDWLGHKGMVQAAAYIRDKLLEEGILDKALERARSMGRSTAPPEGQGPAPPFDLVLVGHSLGAGTAAILAILLRHQFPSLQCFAYSPPGGTLSMPAAEYTKDFITSVVLGKDVVPRIGLHQLESLRADLINTIKRSKDPKWKTILCSAVCCGCGPVPTSARELQAEGVDAYQAERDGARELSTHPSDASIALTTHSPLYPPGRIIHVVRHHPTKGEQKYEKHWRQMLSKHEPVYQAVWANTTDFDEVLISPVMIQDHMPDNVLEALKKVVPPDKRFSAAAPCSPANCNHVSPENCDTSPSSLPAARSVALGARAGSSPGSSQGSSKGSLGEPLPLLDELRRPSALRL